MTIFFWAALLAFYCNLTDLEYKSGFSSNYTETESHTAIICNDKVIESINFNSINNMKILNSVNRMYDFSNRVVSEILKMRVN